MLKAIQLAHPPVLQSVDLSVSPGEMVALVGGNGSGKSTLLRLLAGLVPVPSGRVEIDGTSSDSPEFLDACRRSLGMVFQNPESQLVANTVDEEVAFGPGQLGLAQAELHERVEWGLRQVGLWERRGWQSHALSAGQKQRLALAAVLAMKPRYLLLDEPTSMLDPQARRELMGYLAQLRGQVGILLVTHRSEELEFCDRVLHLREGTIDLEHPARSLWQNPNLFAGFELAIPSELRLRALLAESTPSRPFARETPLPAENFARFENLEYAYARGTPMRYQALKGVDCRLPLGACSALIGQTGSGKSTLLQHLNLLLRPQSGVCQLWGQPIAEKTPARPIRRQVGMLFQQPESQFFQETVWDEVAYAPANFGLEVDKHTREALAQVDLPAEQFARRNPFELSGGEQRRLALACALAYRPRALVLDEPSAGLDWNHRRRVWQLLRGLDVTLTLISHDLEEVGELAGHLVWLDQGRVVQQGSPATLFGPVQKAGFEIPAWSRWAAEQFPESPLPANEAEFRQWQQG
ncbi:MAG: ATP-binding cassette domain-containing protein [Candidatus Eremiobacteraeota bacterium]|nr:ATP-binding cassette domain-containing protein [Candidatus Eremiobacteraeota bacterium]MCW5868277.1 ATP-binding cassette domain-containing protein [Candidatus Eremiobacteraeota bacterium]